MGDAYDGMVKALAILLGFSILNSWGMWLGKMISLCAWCFGGLCHRVVARRRRLH